MTKNFPAIRSRKSTLCVLIAFAVCTAGFLIIGCQPAGQLMNPSATPVPTSDLQVTSTKEDCLAKGGHWEELGLRAHGQPGCNPPTTDGNRPCSSTGDCETTCLANPDELAKLKESTRPLSESLSDSEFLMNVVFKVRGVVGICASWKYTFGCRLVVIEGRYDLYCSASPSLP